jgi:SAM-dependent methyltransferase
MGSADFPRYFEAQYAQYTEDIPFWLELGRECHGTVLELGCGYGRVLRALAAAGIPVVGIDNDPGMLARAAAHSSAGFRHLVSLHQSDIRDYTLGRFFPLAISPCNTFAFLPDDEFQQAAACAARHLQRGGRLVLDLPAQMADEANLTGAPELCSAFDDLESGNPVQVSSLERADGSLIHVTWLYDELFPDGRVKRTEIPMTYHLRDPEAISGLLSSAGFESIEFFGNLQRSPWRRGSPRIIASASM